MSDLVNVAELIEMLSAIEDKSMPVILSSDAEGNSFGNFADLEVGWRGGDELEGYDQDEHDPEDWDEWLAEGFLIEAAVLYPC